MTDSVLKLFGDPKVGRWPTAREIEQEIKQRERELMAAAINARTKAFHYAGRVLVGTAVLACRFGPDGARFAVFTGWNNTPAKRQPGDLSPKPCGERMAIANAMQAGYSWVVSVVVYNPDNQADDVSGVWFKAWLPCYYCAEFMWPIATPVLKVMAFRPRKESEESDDPDYVIARTTYETLALLHRNGAKKSW